MYTISYTLKRLHAFIGFVTISKALINVRRKSRIFDVQYFRVSDCTCTGGWEG